MKKLYLLVSLLALLNTITFAQSNSFQFAPLQGVYAGVDNNFLGITAADFDGDGSSDVAGILQDVNVFGVFKSNSTGNAASFSPRVDYPLAGKPVSIITGDVDLDGKPDVIVQTWQQDGISVFRNTSADGVISFAQRVDYDMPVFPFSLYQSKQLAIGDISGDGLPDIIAINGTEPGIYIFKNGGGTGINFLPYQAFAIQIASPFAIVAQNFDMDQKPDLFVVNTLGYLLNLKNESSGNNIQLTQGVPFMVQTGSPRGLIAEDFNQDSKADLAIITHTKQLEVYKNTTTAGTLSFAAPILAQVANTVWHLNSGDFNMDGKKDILFINNASPGGVFSLFKNIGTGGNIELAEKQDINITYSPQQAVIADPNNDGRADIIATDGSSYFYVLSNTTGEPVIQSFAPIFGEKGDTIKITGRSFTYATEVKFGSVNATSFVIENDSTIKAVIDTGATGAVSVSSLYKAAQIDGFLFGIPQPPVITSILPHSGPAGTAVTITGKHFDTVAFNNIVYFGAGKATVTHATDSTITVVAPITATFQPVTVTNNGKTGFSEKPFTLTFTGGGSINYQSFSPDTSFGAISRPRQMAIADLDLDGKSDLVVSFDGFLDRYFVSVIRNRSIPDSTAFGQRIDYVSPGIPSCVTLEDLDGDGKKDMIVASSGGEKVFVYRNITDTYWIDFAARQEYKIGLKPSAVTVNDLNGDGRPEIIATNDQDGSFSVLLNTGGKGHISFAEKKTWPLGFWPRVIGVRDFDGDGKADIVSAGIPGYLFVLRNTSTEDSLSFGDTININIPGMVNALGLGDIDGDDKTDVVLGRIGSDAIGVLRNISNSGNIVFATPVYAGDSASVQSIDIGDLNGDGKPDVVFTKATGAFAILENNSNIGNIAFQAEDSFTVGKSLYCASIGDLDGDGKPDIVAGDDSIRIRIIKNRMAQALVTSSGANPVSGGMTNKVTVDSTVQTYQGHPYVQRHYDITPANNPSTATATITLYFTQQEFDNYNAHPAHGLDLPHHPTDDFNKANLRVYQYHGFSTTSLPGSYSGNGVEIDPDDTKIVWNATTLQWEVTFDVNGFSGFFIGSAGNSILPVTILSFGGKVIDNIARLQWTTTREINVSHFELQRQDNNSEFVTIGKINAANGNDLEYDYHYNDELGGSPVYYYRLKIVDIDQSVTYSKTVMVRSNAVNSSITLGPNPAKSFVVVKHPAMNNAARIKVVDLNGKVVKAVIVGKNTLQTRVELTGISRGTYTIVWDEGTSTTSQVLIVQ